MGVWWYNNSVGGKRGLAKADLFEMVKAYFVESDGTKSASELYSWLLDKGVVEDFSDLVRDDNVYPFVKSRLLSQGVKLPKHAHESIMKDFEDVFGSRRESSTVIVKTIKNIGIGLEEFIEETESKDKTDIVDFGKRE
jgi:hypothetical protein